MATEDQQHHDKDILPEEQPQQSTEGQPPVDEAAIAAEEIRAADSEPTLQAEVDSLKEKLLLAHAEMQNLRRRADRDVENAHKFALDKFVGDLVPVVDNLERAVAAIDRSDDTFATLAEGVDLTLKNLLDVLRRFNVERIDPKDQLFNPELHEAVATAPIPGVAANTVIDVLQKGYLLNGRLVRPAMVVVAKGA